MTAQTEMQQKLTDEKRSGLAKYQDMFVGKKGFLALLKYELITSWFGPCAGAFGLVTRKVLFRRLLGRCGRGVVFGRNVVLRHPHKIAIGDNVIIDDNCVLDAKGEDNEGIHIGDNVILSRNTALVSKNGSIYLGDNTNLGANCLIQSESSVRIGSNILFASYCYIVGGGNHAFSRTDIPIIQQPPISKGGIVIEDNCWLGARVTVLDGVTIGRDTVVGAGAMVLKDLPEFTIAVGVPAKVIKNRKEEESA